MENPHVSLWMSRAAPCARARPSVLSLPFGLVRFVGCFPSLFSLDTLVAESLGLLMGFLLAHSHSPHAVFRTIPLIPARQ